MEDEELVGRNVLKGSLNSIGKKLNGLVWLRIGTIGFNL
jgi:hypothetical protein